jgi:hypothetical protein
MPRTGASRIVRALAGTSATFPRKRLVQDFTNHFRGTALTSRGERRSMARRRPGRNALCNHELCIEDPSWERPHFQAALLRGTAIGIL